MVKNLPSSAGDAGLIPGWGTRSHPHATTKTRCSQINFTKGLVEVYTVPGSVPRGWAVLSHLIIAATLWGDSVTTPQFMMWTLLCQATMVGNQEKSWKEENLEKKQIQVFVVGNYKHSGNCLHLWVNSGGSKGYWAMYHWLFCKNNEKWWRLRQFSEMIEIQEWMKISWPHWGKMSP